jgi:multicomponent Na+:H+ antiporter subunit D
MTQQILIAPILLQFGLAIVLMFFWFHIRYQRVISILGSVLAVISAAMLFKRVWHDGILSLQAGSWAAPFGITLVADTLSATLVLLTSLVALAVSLFSAGSMINSRLRFGYFPILHLLVVGLNGAFLTGDIFNMYVWFEIMIISSFVLLTLGGEKAQLEGAVKYFTMNILASMIFLTALAVLYGLTGTLNMADLSLRIAALEQRSLVDVCALLFFVGFGIKAAVFPLYFWLPASYHTPPPAVSAIFGGLLTKVGVYAMFRVFTLMFGRDPFIENMLVIVAFFTLFSGALGALTRNNIVKVFSWLIICHIGFMVAGLAMYSELALAGAVFYMIHDIVVKANLFMLAGVSNKITGTNRLQHMGGLYAHYPKISLLMAIPLFSLVGIPPLSGFWPKLSLLLGGIAVEKWALVVMIVLASFATLFVIARVWAEAFWKKQPEYERPQPFRYFDDYPLLKRWLMLAPIALLAGVSLYIAFGATNIQSLAERIAHELLHPEVYIEAVLSPNKEVQP